MFGQQPRGLYSHFKVLGENFTFLFAHENLGLKAKIGYHTQLAKVCVTHGNESCQDKIKKKKKEKEREMHYPLPVI